MSVSEPLVVIVDDVPENIKVLHHCLKNDGYSFAIAENAGELFKLIQYRSPTLVLLDVMLPDMDGFSAAEKLRSDSRFFDVPIIFISARTDYEDKVRGFLSGGVDYVTKPFHCAEIRERVRTHIALRSALEEQRRLNLELAAALQRVRKLEGIIPICSRCKKIRDDDGFWTQVEQYIAEHTSAMFSHGLCPDCATHFFPQDVLHENGS